MSQNVTADVNFSISATEVLTLAFGSGKLQPILTQDVALAAGTGANNINALWSWTSTPAASPDTWQLSALVDSITRTIGFGKVRAIGIQNLSAVDGQDLYVRSPVIVAPASQPTGAASGSDGSLSVGNYLISYTWTNANGETIPSPDSSAVAVASTNHLTVTIPALPTGVTGANIYVSTVGGGTGTETRQNAAPVTGTTFTLLSLVAGAPKPTLNTCAYKGLTTLSRAGYFEFIVKPGGFLAIAAPLATAYGVTTTTADKLVIDPIGNTIAYKIMLLGE